MPDRRHRAHLSRPTSLPLAADGGPTLLLRENRPPESPSGSGPSGSPGSGPDRPDSAPADDNPFAAPPEGRPDRPWRPRRPDGSEDDGDAGSGDSSRGGDRSPWGGRWSSDQPGRQGGGFGDRPGQDDPRKGGPGPGGLRWDPKDPAQRRARYALLAGMWSFFTTILIAPELGLLLGALAIYWGVSALRSRQPAGAPVRADVDAMTGRSPAPAPGSDAPAGPALGARQLKSAAVSGLVMAGLSLCVVAAGFTAKLVYSDYYTCVDDALTSVAKDNCRDLLPERLRPLLAPEE
ncbi:hypothetical protein [Streptomyces sp. NPDC060194]|uniref:hypothetical protein n=1 Tax=Streptomyces sp. NPDC060194 TaxID=3347069 RepID=UPI0036643D5B